MDSRIGRRYRLPPLFVAVGIVHAIAAAVLLDDWHWWPWLVLVLVASHGLIAASVLLPRAALLGPNQTVLTGAAVKTGSVALTFDDGPDPDVTRAVLDLLDASHAKASFFCLGQNVERYPDLAREIVARGHTVENHSYRHPVAFSFYGMKRLAREVDRTQTAILKATGKSARYFRAPAGFRSPLLEVVLAARGLHYVSWRRRGFDAVSKDPDRILGRLLRNLAAGDILLLHDRGANRTANGVPLILVVLPRLLAALQQAGLHSIALP